MIAASRNLGELLLYYAIGPRVLLSEGSRATRDRQAIAEGSIPSPERFVRASTNAPATGDTCSSRS